VTVEDPASIDLAPSDWPLLHLRLFGGGQGSGLGRRSGMAERTPVAEQPLVAADATAATPWAEVRERLETPERDRIYWLATVRPDGRPHIRPVLGVWLNAAFYFITGETTRKGRNLVANPQCVMAASSHVLPALDVIVEGDAVKVTDEAKVHRVADAYTSTLHWPLTVRDGAVFGPNAPTAGSTAICSVRAHAHDGLRSPGHRRDRRRRRCSRLIHPDPLAILGSNLRASSWSRSSR
jgi:nitroimidazol reductase NimA-like FMN-containing flavoprotein (pyridoxamine 5'-phosphate oxidase superfamily)